MRNSKKYVVGLIDQNHRIGMERLLDSAQNAHVDFVETLPALVDLIQQKTPHYIIICCAHQHPTAVEHLMDLRQIINMDHVHILVLFSLPDKEDIVRLLG